MAKVNWANLLQQDRCRALGVPWSPDELKALHKEEVPASYVRAGVLTKKDYEKHIAREEIEGKKLEMMDLNELSEKATELGVKFAGVTPRETLISLIKKAELLKEAGIDEEEEESEEVEEDRDEEESEEVEEDEDESEEDEEDAEVEEEESEEVENKDEEEDEVAKELAKKKAKVKKKKARKKRNKNK